MTATSPRPVPARLADFEIVRRLGVGGMAEVFLAKKRGAEGTFKLLVVKRILPAYGSSRRFRAMFAEEAQLATRLNHPNIVQVYDFQDYGDEGQLLSMEFVEGADLRKLLRAGQTKRQRLPPYVAAYIIAEVAKGLHYAHERTDERGKPLEIVHRDVSPQNILLSFDGSVKIADFGIATANVFREELGVLKGKAGFMSPEQAWGKKIDRRSDIYSLGVVFHEMLTGRPLHGALEGQELLDAVRAAQVEPPSTFAVEVPSELEEVAMRTLAKKPDDRFATARELSASITQLLFQKHQLVDSHLLESTLAELATRDQTPPDPDDLPADAGSAAASFVPSRSDGAEEGSDAQTGPGQPLPGTLLRDRVGREVRHVAVVTLRLHRFDELESAIGQTNAAHVADQLRATLGEIAFKRGARWSWEALPEDDPERQYSARAVVGLTADPARAAQDAASLAVDAHEAIHGASVDLPVEVQASVGIVRAIATGQRDRAGHLVDYELKEPAPYLTELLVSLTPAGLTWVTGGLYRLLRQDFVWGDAASLEIEDAHERQLPRTMRIYSLFRSLGRDERLAAQKLAPRNLVGRDVELAELSAAYYAAMSGRAEHAIEARLIYGEHGIGKTALVTAFLTELPPDARALTIECSPAQSEVPYANVVAWIRQLTGLGPGQSLEEVRAGIAEALGEFASDESGPAIVDRMSELMTGQVVAGADEGEAAHNRQLCADGVLRFFARAASEAPLVVVLDGVQWSDLPSLEIISGIMRQNDDLSLLILLVTRPDERTLVYTEGLVRIELKGLSAENQIGLLQTRLGVQQGVAQTCADLLPRAAGNPYFLLEMVDALLERGALEISETNPGEQELVRVDTAGAGVQELPLTLDQLIADRLNELPEPEQAVISWLAVAGGQLRVEDLQALGGPEAEDAIVRLCARGLCDQRDEIVDVNHPMTREVAYDVLDRPQRVRMHRKLAERLADSPLAKGAAAAMVARHFARGNVKTRAAELYLEAGAAARASYQVSLSRRYYRHVIRLLPEDDPRRLEAHEALEAVYRTLGRWRERRHYLTQLRQLARISGSAYWVATALLRTARFQLDTGRLSQALASAQRAREVSAQAGSFVLSVQAEELAAETLRDLGDMQGALAAADRALEQASRSDVPPRLRAEVLRARGTLLRRVGRVHESVDAFAEALAVFRLTGARRMEAQTKNSLAFAMYVLGRFEDGVALALDAIQIDLAIGGRFQIATTLCTIGQCYAGLGDIERALAYLRRAHEAHEHYGQQDSRSDTLLSMAEVLIDNGDLITARALVGDAGALAAVTGRAYDSVREKILRAVLARSASDLGAAVAHAFEARQVAEAQAYVSLHFYAMAIEAVSRVGIGEQHTGILLATTAMGAVDTLQGSEYGLAIRALCCEALRKANSPQLEQMRERAAGYVTSLMSGIRDPELKALFLQRPYVADLLGVEMTRELSAKISVRPTLEEPTAL
ncbi:MAG TPA: protein kinase [Polyangiaceae bacterium]|jgi:serine/threonine protein kinase/tetratricopeptide (TPR) repeat protein